MNWKVLFCHGVSVLCCFIPQFEATDARLALPCWDEPAFKATFDVKITVSSELTALSNMPVIADVPSADGARKTLTYSTTPIMSTYLLAFVVGELEKVSAVTEEGVEVNVYTTPGKKEVMLTPFIFSIRSSAYACAQRPSLPLALACHFGLHPALTSPACHACCCACPAHVVILPDAQPC